MHSYMCMHDKYVNLSLDTLLNLVVMPPTKRNEMTRQYSTYSKPNFYTRPGLDTLAFFLLHHDKEN